MFAPRSPRLDNKSLTAKATSGTVAVLTGQIIRLATLAFQLIILSRLLGPEYFGLLAMVTAIVALGHLLRDFGLSTSALRDPGLTHQQQSNLFWTNVLIGAALCAALVAGSTSLANFYAEPRVQEVARWVSITFIMAGISAQFRVRLSAQMQFWRLAACETIPSVISVGAATTLALRDLPLLAIIALPTVQATADLVLSVLLARWHPTLPRKCAGMRPLYSFGASYAGSQAISYVSRSIDSVLVGRIYGARELGYYDRAFQIAVTPLNQINTPMTKVALPVLSAVRTDTDRLLRALHQAQMLALYLTASLLAIGAGLSGPLVELALGTDWQPVGPLFTALAIGAIFRSMQQVSLWLQVVKGTSRELLFGTALGQPLIVICILVGTKWGTIGVAIGSTVGYGVFWLFSMWWASKTTGVPTAALTVRAARVLLTVTLPLGATAYFASMPLSESPLAAVIAGTSAGTVAATASIALVPASKRDLRVLYQLRRR